MFTLGICGFSAQSSNDLNKQRNRNQETEQDAESRHNMGIPV